MPTPVLDATITALPTPPSSTDKANFKSRADAFMAALPTMGTEYNAALSQYNEAFIWTAEQVSQVSTDASVAASSASSAATSESNAATSASNAEASASAASTSEANAAGSASAASASEVNAAAAEASATATAALLQDALDLLSSFEIGTPGEAGFGVGAIHDSALPLNWVKLAGHHDPAHANYGNVLDPTGSVMVWIPAFWFKWNADNTVDISSSEQDGFVLHRAFIDGGAVKAGFFVDKYGCGNVGGVFASAQGIDPCSTHPDHNPIGSLSNAPVNNYGGLYKAVKTRSADHFLTSIFIYNALALLAHAAGIAGTNCAFSDVAPYHPKGCNNNALADVNDSGVTFTGSGYSNCALTGSGAPFAKTTHNGQNCGVADLNGNMWEVASGFIKYGEADAVFKLIKESVRMADIPDDDTTQGSGGAYDIDLYDDLDLTGSMTADASSKFGNASNQVFAMNTSRTSEQYRMTCAGLPMIGGYSAAGTTAMGNDYYREYWRDQMAPVVGGLWGNSSHAGVFALFVLYGRTSTYDAVGGRASVYL